MPSMCSGGKAFHTCWNQRGQRFSAFADRSLQTERATCIDARIRDFNVHLAAPLDFGGAIDSHEWTIAKYTEDVSEAVSKPHSHTMNSPKRDGEGFARKNSQGCTTRCAGIKRFVGYG